MNIEIYKNISYPLFLFNEESDIKKQLLQDKKIDVISFWILLFSLLILLVSCLYLFINLLIHLIKTIKNPNSKFFIFWIDYFGVSFVSISFIVAYTIFLLLFILIPIIKGEDIDRENPEILNENFNFKKILMWFPSFTLTLMIFIVIDNLILDIIHFSILIYKMYKLYSIKDYDDIKKVYEKCKDENFNNIFKSKVHCTLISIIIIFDLYGLSYFGISMNRFTKINIKEVINNIKSNETFIFDFNLFIGILKIIQVFVSLFIIFIMIISTYFKKELLESNYYNNDILIQKIYNSTISKICFHKDFFTFKTILDFTMNIPLLLYFALDQLSTIPIIISGICLLNYIFFMGAIFLYIEKNNKMSNVTDNISQIFFLNKLNFKFGEREKKKQIEELNFEYNEFEAKVMNELSDPLNVSQELVDKVKEENFLTSDVIITQDDNEEDENENFIDLSTEENYFIIFKLIYIYFEENKNLYEEVENEMEKITVFKNIHLNNNNYNNQDYLIGVEKISNLSKLNQKEINQFFTIGSNNVFYTLEEKEFREKFKENNKIDEKTYLKKSNKLFIIESYFTEELFTLFPFYQITINDLLYSINPAYNKNLFEKFAKNKNDNDKKEKDINSNIENNYFYTFNSFLSFESYDENEEFNLKLLKNFISNYNNYLMNILKNMNYTFLPLIIGVFKIKYLKKNKIIILYRNPLLFSQNNIFKYWFNLFNNNSEIVLKKKNKEILNIDEIKKNNISLKENDYNELLKTINKDFNFMKDYSFFPIINIFIGRNKDENINDNDSQLKDMSFASINENDNSICEPKMYINYKKYDNGTELISFFEKEYNCPEDNKKYSIKIHFTNFFRSNNNIKDINNNENNNLSNETYFNFIKNDVLKYIK